MGIDANAVFMLSKETGLGTELCKLALERAQNNSELARSKLEHWLNPEKRHSKTDTTPSNAKLHSVVSTFFAPNHSTAAVVDVSCTDGDLTKSDKFYDLVSGINSEIAMIGEIHYGSETIKSLEKEYNCKINVSSARLFKSNQFSLLTTYSHKGKIGVIVETEVDNEQAFYDKQFRIFSFDCALHIAAYDPVALSKDKIADDVSHNIKRQIEKDLVKEGKPMKHWEAAIEGKFTSWAERRSLLTQIFIKSDKTTVNEMRAIIGNCVGSDIKITRFVRFATETQNV